MLSIEYTIPRYESTSSFPLRTILAWLIIPNAGRISTYTSGCPKNQNKCWYNNTLPPPPLSKKLVFSFRSKRSIVMPQASTGNLRINRNTVTSRVQINKRIDSSGRLPFPHRTVLIKLKLANKLLSPARCSLIILRSTAMP